MHSLSQWMLILIAIHSICQNQAVQIPLPKFAILRISHGGRHIKGEHEGDHTITITRRGPAHILHPIKVTLAAAFGAKKEIHHEYLPKGSLATFHDDSCHVHASDDTAHHKRQGKFVQLGSIEIEVDPKQAAAAAYFLKQTNDELGKIYASTGIKLNLHCLILSKVTKTQKCLKHPSIWS